MSAQGPAALGLAVARVVALLLEVLGGQEELRARRALVVAGRLAEEEAVVAAEVEVEVEAEVVGAVALALVMTILVPITVQVPDPEEGLILITLHRAPIRPVERKAPIK